MQVSPTTRSQGADLYYVIALVPPPLWHCACANQFWSSGFMVGLWVMLAKLGCSLASPFLFGLWVMLAKLGCADVRAAGIWSCSFSHAVDLCSIARGSGDQCYQSLTVMFSMMFSASSRRLRWWILNQNRKDAVEVQSMVGDLTSYTVPAGATGNELSKDGLHSFMVGLWVCSVRAGLCSMPLPSYVARWNCVRASGVRALGPLVSWCAVSAMR